MTQKKKRKSTLSRWLRIVLIFSIILFVVILFTIYMFISTFKLPPYGFGPGCSDYPPGYCFNWLAGVVSTNDNSVLSNATITIRGQNYDEDPYSEPKTQMIDSSGEFYLNYHYYLAGGIIELEISADNCTTFTEVVYDNEWLIDEEQLENLAFELDCN